MEAKTLPFEIIHYASLGLDDLLDPEPPRRPVPDGVAAHVPAPAAFSPMPKAAVQEKSDLKTVASNAEYEMIMRVLQQSRFNKSMAAQFLGIDRKTLYNKLKNYNIE